MDFLRVGMKVIGIGASLALLVRTEREWQALTDIAASPEEKGSRGRGSRYRR
jgi:hypothetical protein